MGHADPNIYEQPKLGQGTGNMGQVTKVAGTLLILCCFVSMTSLIMIGVLLQRVQNEATVTIEVQRTVQELKDTSYIQNVTLHEKSYLTITAIAEMQRDLQELKDASYIEQQNVTLHEKSDRTMSAITELESIIRSTNQTATVQVAKLDAILAQLLNNADTRNTSDSIIRLMSGTHPTNKYFGRVEIKHSGVWGTICDDDWDLNDAKVVCRMLGYTGAISAPHLASFGEGTGQIWLNNVDCNGTEDTILNCRGIVWGGHDLCEHHEDASVVCNN